MRKRQGNGKGMQEAKTYRQILGEAFLEDKMKKKYPKLVKDIDSEIKMGKQISKEENDEVVVFIDNGKEVGTARNAKGKGIEIVARFNNGRRVG